MSEPPFILTRLDRVTAQGGDVIRFLRADELGVRIAEVYFSLVEKNRIKAWRRHRQATIFVTVPTGQIRFVVIDSSGDFFEANLSPEHPHLLMIPPGHWFGFQARGESEAIVASGTDILHDPSEVDRAETSEFKFEWSQL